MSTLELLLKKGTIEPKDISVADLYEELKKIGSTLSKIDSKFYSTWDLPKSEKWAYHLLTPKDPEPIAVAARSRKRLWGPGDFPTDAGWIYSVILSGDNPQLGLSIKFRNPDGTLAEVSQTFASLKALGLVGILCPGTGVVTVWNSPTAPEYVYFMPPSFSMPYSAAKLKMLMEIYNDSATTAGNFYYCRAVLVSIFE